ncbi:Short-chain dehydrogenase/reductase family protein [Mycena sanguinolenta]|uniref:Short-chain dehydrogenase/reductase family protein n=1 Tax=Mycena sanguinolenta TaxID=230812 RepID=A0A8H6XB09_9AGAR|nr:Short-chain dehydrogenase/reductase family protein [Mycena sanguinolenta]
MILSNFLFSPHTRVWNLRLLLLSTIVVLVILSVEFPGARQEYEYYGLVPLRLPWEILFPTISIILLHHVASVTDWPTPGLAIVDLILIFGEIGGLIAGFLRVIGSWADLFPSFFKFIFIPVGLSLALSIVFRTATIVRSRGRFFRQRFAFLGACTRASPPYSPAAILLNRSVARPLVSGESKIILVARAFILTCLALGVPAFGIYSIVVSPIQASVYTRSVATFAAADLDNLPSSGHVTFLMGFFGLNGSATTLGDFSVNLVSLGTQGNCSVTFADAGAERLVECTLPWGGLQPGSMISINLTIPSGYAVNIMPLSEKPSTTPLGAFFSEFTRAQPDSHSVRLQIPSDSVPVVPGSHLFGRLTWTQRKTVSRRALGIPTASKSVFIAEITGLQPYPSDSITGTNEATLVLFHPYPYAIKLQQDSLDITLLSGLSTFGGFWTSIEGVFILLFGANVLYFALGRRPLSALGLIHIFQRRALVRQWHADFPALRTEGGQPGSESAGVVAFIRERLIDIGQDAQPNEFEAQHSRSNSGSDEELMRAAMKETDGSEDAEKINLNPLYK